MDSTIVYCTHMIQDGTLCYVFECFEESLFGTKLNAGLSEQQQEDLFENERNFHKLEL